MPPQPSPDRGSGISRRLLLRRALQLSTTAGFAPLIGACAPRPAPSAGGRWEGRFLTLATPGGAVRQALWEAIFTPFHAVTGCTVMDVTSTTADLPNEVRRQALTGQVQWDLVCLSMPLLAALAEDDPPLFAVLPERLRQPGPGVPENLARLGRIAFGDTLSLAVRTGRYGGRQPSSWAQVWRGADGDFAGPRALPLDPVGLLEIALLADGLTPETLYPLDLDRAFRSLDRIRPAVNRWWQRTLQPGNLLANGEADLVLASGSDLRAAIEGGALAVLADLPTPAIPLGLAIPRDGPNGDIATDFIAWVSQPAAQTALAAAGFLSATQALASTTQRNSRTIGVDLAWWLERGAGARQRFYDWYANAKNP